MGNVSNLTKQEQTVLALVAQGKRNAAIASELTISLRTVETHLYRIFDKLGVSSRTEAALFMLRQDAPWRKKVSGISDDIRGENSYSGI